MARGGKRIGAGRRTGVKHRRTLAKEAGRLRALAAVGLKEEHVTGELVRVAFTDMRQFFDGDNLKPISAWTPEQGAQVVSFEIIKKNAEAGDDHTDVVHKFKVADKLKALEMLGKSFGLFEERLKVQGEVVFSWKQ